MWKPRGTSRFITLPPLKKRETIMENESSTAVSELYHAMSETVERLLPPLTMPETAVLCQSPGGMGTILPLHIASIFTVSVRTMRLTVEAFPRRSASPFL
jgi:hypothetical protein